ncbi:hypothetical protein BABINDRAFT_162637 [Babjeviella inositovora NRRL Y-12698]|uniref:Uncharacterized protein n=1 Tax=Babjeviella inositovora NRRL Y-12698 TaxID=984486 RepID=A0A1E3QMT6_9ASCO|nr:uncharacterized protein BABINDRAFT_162637 [Babjeviella inositovora NRRL Y-12698]ODQ78402.1 hypothetical protein BABINDRAFT_162637 [Babjeviella inositovora NRRL Y-12698]
MEYSSRGHTAEPEQPRDTPEQSEQPAEDTRDSRDAREYRERDSREYREFREPREYRDSRYRDRESTRSSYRPDGPVEPVLPPASEVPDVVYDITETPLFNKTRALFIGNLTSPINAHNFQTFLKHIAEPATIERAWLNRLRSHSIVLCSDEEGAERIRGILNGSKYPSVEDDEAMLRDLREDKPDMEIVRNALFVDYIPVKRINQWTYEEDRGPRDGKWKIEYETQEIREREETPREKDSDDESKAESQVNTDDADIPAAVTTRVIVHHRLLSAGHVPRFRSARGGRGGPRGGYRGRGYGDRPARDHYTPRNEGRDGYAPPHPHAQRPYGGSRYEPQGSRYDPQQSHPYYTRPSRLRERSPRRERDHYERPRSRTRSRSPRF